MNYEHNYKGSYMNREEFLTYVTSTYNAEPEYLWEKLPTACVFRHKSNNKWFCAVLTVKKSALNSEVIVGNDNTLIDIVDIKAHPLFINSLKEKKGILPGYHMNKEHWITLLLGDYLADDEIKALLEESYQLTK